jgi:hypothetical protein
MDEATARRLFDVANYATTTFVSVPWEQMLDLAQFWLDNHKVESGGQEVWETKQVNVYAKVEDGNG